MSHVNMQLTPLQGELHCPGPLPICGPGEVHGDAHTLPETQVCPGGQVPFVLQGAPMRYSWLPLLLLQPSTTASSSPKRRVKT
jgi:hypothetical protein